MPELNITRGYTDGEALLETDLDAIRDAVVTLNNTTLYDGDNLQNALITTSKVVADSVTSATLGVGCITTHKVNDLAITTAKILDGDIETRLIADLNVTTGKLADLAVTSAKFSTAARLSSTKIEAKSVFTGSNASPTSVTYGDPLTTIATATATADTRYCMIMLQPYDSTAAYVELTKDYGSAGHFEGYIRFNKNGSEIARRYISIGNADIYAHYLRIPVSSFSAMYVAATIANTDTITARLFLDRITGAGNATLTITACKIVVVEL